MERKEEEYLAGSALRALSLSLSTAFCVCVHAMGERGCEGALTVSVFVLFFPRQKNAASLLKIVSHTGDSCVRQHYYYYYCCAVYFSDAESFWGARAQIAACSG